jgi:hypothetical protein
MSNPAQMLSSPGIPPRAVVSGYVSKSKPAPASFGDPVWVIVPSHSLEVAIPSEWGAIHGATLPAQGALVTLVYDENDTGVVVWWAGVHS